MGYRSLRLFAGHFQTWALEIRKQILLDLPINKISKILDIKNIILIHCSTQITTNY